MERQIYLLNPKQLSPETIAVTFAKTSRSPESFREIAAGLTDDKSAEFHEKWVVGYGHASVAEHAVLHIAVENVSRLAIESLESNRLASYTEKSTRYQKWDPQAFYTPQEFSGEALRIYSDACQVLFETYQAAIPAVKTVAELKNPRLEGEKDGAWDRRIRSQYVDVCRYLLPAGSLANVGITANARVLEHAISKMLSDPLPEVREIGLEIKQVAQAEVPTLVKYADRVPYLQSAQSSLSDQAREMDYETPPENDWCQLVGYDPQGQERVLAASIYRFGQMSYEQALVWVCSLGETVRNQLAEQILGSLGRYDDPLRELEHSSYSFDIVMDQGGYFELKRHRMMTQTPQVLTAKLGYAMPLWFVEAGMEQDYRQAMDTATQAYQVLAQSHPAGAAYVVPNGFNRRVLLNLNLRTAFHLCELRAAENAHFSMRRLAFRIAEEIRRVHPVLARWMRIPEGESWQQVEANNFFNP